jgi:toxin ParE1/3/4
MLERLQQRFDSLLSFPYIGQSQDRYRAGLRSIVEGKYIIFYEPRPDEIVIFRVLHGARNWEDLL